MNLHIHGHVLPGDKEQDIYVVNGHITFQKVKDAKTVVKDGYILPGLVDCHAHLSLASPAGDEASSEERVRASAKEHLHAGVLAIREPGSPDYASKEISPAEGLPRIQTGGRFLAPPGGYFSGLAREVEEDKLPDAVEEEARKSGAWAKIIGDFPGEDGRFHPNFRLETLRQAAERVHKLGARIAIHSVIPESIEMAIEAGFDSIEHGTMLEANHIVEMARRKMTLVPTMVIREGILELVRGFGLTADESRRGEIAVKKQAEMVRKAVEAGVVVLAGTDAGMVAHGIVRREIENFFEAGIPGEIALGAGSWSARAFLGLPGIEEGAHADLVVFAKDPRHHKEELSKPTFIMLDGRQVSPPSNR